MTCWTAIAKKLSRKADPPKQLRKTRVGAQGVKIGIEFEIEQIAGTLVVGAIQPFECGIGVPNLGVKLDEGHRRDIVLPGGAVEPLQLSLPDSFQRSADA